MGQLNIKDEQPDRRSEGARGAARDLRDRRRAPGGAGAAGARARRAASASGSARYLRRSWRSPSGRRCSPARTRTSDHAELLYDPRTGLPSVIVDTSAIVAILRREPEAPCLSTASLRGAAAPAMSAATLVETAMVAEGRAGDGQAGADLDSFMADAGIEIVAVHGRARARLRARGWRRFGKGRHPAGPQPRRLLRLRPGAGAGRAAAVQGRGLRPHRRAAGGVGRCPSCCSNSSPRRSRRGCRRARRRTCRACSPPGSRRCWKASRAPSTGRAACR